MAQNKLRVAIDVSTAAKPQKSGVGYYTLGLLKALAQFHGDELEITGHYYNFLGRQSLNPLPDHPAIHYKISRLLPQKAVNLLRRMGLEIPYELLTKRRADVHLFPNYLSQPSLFKTSSICTIHDLAYIDMPETLSQRNQSDLKRFVPKSIKRSKAVATVSQFMAERLKQTYQLTKPVIVTYTPPSLLETNGLDKPELSKFVSIDLKSLGITKKFILHMGNMEPRKNIDGLVAAYGLLAPELRSSYQLVLAGGDGWKSEKTRQSIEQSRLQGLDIITTGYVSDAQRAGLYAQSSLFVFPSFYEGQGIPPLEAMAAGVPVVVSDIPVLKEICDEAAAYCDPKDPSAISKIMSALLINESQRQTLINSGQKHISNFSWQKLADAVVASLRG